jgi:hypothetical protein
VHGTERQDVAATVAHPTRVAANLRGACLTAVLLDSVIATRRLLRITHRIIQCIPLWRVPKRCALLAAYF